MLKDLFRRNRSYRRFYQKVPVGLETMRELVDLARLTASSGNQQPLKYILCCDPEVNASVFSCLNWAGYLADWAGPVEGERPAAYIIILGDTEIARSIDCDHGIAAQSILLGATERGLGGCIISHPKARPLRDALNISQRYRIRLVIALGKPKEQVVIESIGSDGDHRYYRDDQGVHHVPKRSVDELVVQTYGG